MSAEKPIHENLCQTCQELVGSDGSSELSPRERELLENHLAECPDCRRLFEEHRAVWKLLGELPHPSPRTGDAEFLASVRGRLRPFRPWRRVAALAAAAVILAGGSLMLFFPDREDPAIEEIIENIAVLEDLDDLSSETADVAEVGLELLSLLQEDLPGGDEEDWIDILDVLVEEDRERG